MNPDYGGLRILYFKRRSRRRKAKRKERREGRKEKESHYRIKLSISTNEKAVNVLII